MMVLPQAIQQAQVWQTGLSYPNHRLILLILYIGGSRRSRNNRKNITQNMLAMLELQLWQGSTDELCWFQRFRKCIGGCTRCVQRPFVGCYLIIKQKMSEQNIQNADSKRQYSRIPVKKRMLLVKQVLKKGRPLSEIIQTLNIKITTARFILNKYKESGAFPRRKFRKRGCRRKPRIVKEENREQHLEQGTNLMGSENQTQVKIEEWPQLKEEENLKAPIYLYWYCYPLGE